MSKHFREDAIKRFILCVAFFMAFCYSIRSEAQNLLSHVDSNVEPPQWTYTLFNDENLNSSNYLGYFNLTVNAPFSVTGTPAGWGYQTDGFSYVLWSNLDPVLPYPNDIAPGSSLRGFSIESSATASSLTAFSVSAWDHNTDAPGPIVTGNVLAPYAPPPSVPEPSGIVLIGFVAAGTAITLRRKRQ